jgi:hypothetical protein
MTDTTDYKYHAPRKAHALLHALNVVTVTGLHLVLLAGTHVQPKPHPKYGTVLFVSTGQYCGYTVIPEEHNER